MTNEWVPRNEYSKKLQDPRWQKKRLEVLRRDEWMCQHCYNKDETLHVHHRWYAKDGEPWDVPLEALQTLCATCHSEETELGGAGKSLLDALRRLGCANTDLSQLTFAVEEAIFDYRSLSPKGCVLLDRPDVDLFTELFYELVRSAVANHCRIDPTRVRYDMVRSRQESERLFPLARWALPTDECARRVADCEWGR